MTEKDLRPIVEKYLQEQGLYVAHEVMLSGYVDMTGCLWAERVGRRIPPMLKIVAVELKINDILGVLSQARNNRYFADYSWAAMPLKKCNCMRLATLQRFKEQGIGLMAVGNIVKVMVNADRNIIEHSSLVLRRLWDFKRRHTNIAHSENKRAGPSDAPENVPTSRTEPQN